MAYLKMPQRNGKNWVINALGIQRGHDMSKKYEDIEAAEFGITKKGILGGSSFCGGGELDREEAISVLKELDDNIGELTPCGHYHEKNYGFTIYTKDGHIHATYLLCDKCAKIITSRTGNEKIQQA